MNKNEKQKKVMSKKKKVISAIVFVFMALVVGTLVHALFLKDTTVSKTMNHTEVVENETYKDIPKDDSTPADYSPEENISICQSVIQNMDAWTSKTEGTAVADVLFINYTQNISASKTIKDGSATQQSVSESSLLSTGQQRTFQDGAILIRNARKVKSMSDIEWEDDFTAVSKDTYSQNYGRTPFALTNYVVDKTTIIKSKTLNSGEGQFKFEYELKPDESTVYYKRQMKTEGGASDYPTFHSVKVTVTMDKQWRPLVIHYSENYDINIAVVGNVTCQGEITETFSDFGQVKALPNQDLVDEFIKNKYDKNKLSNLPEKKDMDVSKYITDMFTDKPYYNVRLTVGNTKLNMDMYIDIQHGIIKMKDQNLFAAYSNGKMYIQYENVKVSMKTDSVFEAIKVISKAVDFDTQSINLDYLTQLDLNNISLDDKVVSGLLNNVKLEQTDDAIKVVFAKDGIQAEIKVALEEESVSLDYANVSVKLGASTVRAQITTADKSDYPELKGFNDISKVTSLLQPWIDTIRAKGVIGKVSVKTKDVKLSGNTVLAYRPLKLKFTSKIDGVKIKAVVVKKTVFVSAGNIKIQCKLKNLENTIKEVMIMAGIDGKKNQFVPKQYADTIQKLKNGNVNIKKLIKSVKSIDFKKGYLNISALINKMSFNVAISKNAIKINQGKNLKIKVNITKTYKKSPQISVKKSQYVKANVILKVLSKLSLYKLLKSKGIILDTTISGKGFTLKGIAKAVYSKGFQIKYTTNIQGIPITLKYKNHVVYVKSGKVMIQGSEKEIYSLLNKVLQKTGIKINYKILLQVKSLDGAFESLIKEYAGNLTVKDIIGNIKTFQYKNGYLIVKYQYAKGKVVTIKLKKKTLSLSVAVLNMNLNAQLRIKKIYTKLPVISVNSNDYTKLSNILNVVEALGLEDILTSTGMDTDVTLNIAGKTIKANIKANYGNTEALLVETNIAEGKVILPVTIKYIDGLFYIDVANVHVKASKNNIESVLSKVLEGQKVSDIFVKDFSAVVKGITETMSAKDILNNIKTFSCSKDTLKIQYNWNSRVIDIAVTGRNITVKGVYWNNSVLDVGVKIHNTKSQTIGLSNGVQYIDLGEAYQLIKTNIDYVNRSKAYGFQADIWLNDKKISADIIYDKSMNACKVSIPYNGETIEVAYVDDMIYIQVGKLYIKTTKGKLLELIKEYSGYEIDKTFSDIHMKELISLASILKIKNVTMKDGKLVVEYVQENTELKAVIENSRDEIHIAGIKIGDISVGGKISLEQFFDKSMIHPSDYDTDKYVELKSVIDFVKKWKAQPAVTLKTKISNKELSVVYEKGNVYTEFDGLKIKADDSSVASIINAVLKIYDVDITPVFQWLGIVEDEKGINLDMFRQYAGSDALDNMFQRKNINFAELLNNISIGTDYISYEGKIAGASVNVKLYDSTITSGMTNANEYMDVSSIDTLLKAFGNTAANLNFDLRAKASLALSLGIIHINLKEVPMYAKLKVEKEGVYGNVHADVPYMKSITDNNILVPDTITETTESTGKTKTQVKTSYSLISDSQKITTDFFVTPEYIYIHKNIKYAVEKTTITTKYKKILVWIPQSSSKETETVHESKDFYIKRTYKEMQKNIMSDMCFALNMTDSIKDKIIESSNETETELVKLGNIIKSYSFDNTERFDFGLNLSSLTDGAIEDTSVNLYKNSNGQLNNLYAECKLYSLVSIKLDADLNNIGQNVDIGFDPKEIATDKNYN